MENFPAFLTWCRLYRANNSALQLRNLTADHIARFGTICPGCDGPMLNYGRQMWRARPLNNHNGIQRAAAACENCGHCRECCECNQCASCERHFDETLCESCDRCRSNCCECLHCGNCGAECEDNYCGDCNTCNSCCDCTPESGSGVEFIHNDLCFHEANRLELKENSSKRFIAVEIEVADLKTNAGKVAAEVDAWSGNIVEDASLPCTGFEINTAPASGDHFVAQIKDICGALNAGNATVNTSCGLHVHVDARDFTYYDIRRLINLYAIIEPALFDMVPSSRKASSYCQPCGAAYKRVISEGRIPNKEAKDQVFKSVYKYSASKQNNKKSLFGRDKYNSARYSALNLHSWFYRGTIECRMFNGTTDAHKITQWGILWATILDYVATHTDDQIADLDDSERGRITLEHIAAGKPALRAFIAERIAKHGGE